ncbi:uncharacterized protein [Nicotiana sylvestris]|uniref:uncharacterized protein n=1 Tax=Nicotiana sylvestris TaxID=4096 RepID=UPI00388C7FE2
MGRIEMMFEQMIKKNADSDTQLASYNTSIRNLEVQLGQISQSLNTCPKGSLPSDTVVNPKGGKNTRHAIAVIIRSGRGGDVNTSKQKEVVSDEVEVQEDDVPIVDEQVSEENMNEEVRIDIHDNEKKNENQYKKFIEMMKILPINVSLVEDLEQMPGYTKFMKDLVTKKRSMDYRTMKRLLGIIDDVLIRVDKFILAADFVILDCEVNYEVPIILGRHFLATKKALVDMEAGELTFRVGDEKVIFHVCKSLKQPNSTEVCSFVDLVTEVIVDDTSAMINVEDPLEAVLLNLDVNEDEGRVEYVNALHGMGSYYYEPRKLSLDLENRKTPPTKPSIEEPPIDATLAVIQIRKKAIGWTLANIRGISPAFCMYNIILEDDAKPSVEH